MLEEFVQLVAQFDSAVALGNVGRTTHVAATRELTALGLQIVQTVRVMNARNRQRFQGNAELLGSWISATKVLGTPHRTAAPVPAPEGTTPPAGDVRPAA